MLQLSRALPTANLRSLRAVPSWPQSNSAGMLEGLEECDDGDLDDDDGCDAACKVGRWS